MRYSISCPAWSNRIKGLVSTPEKSVRKFSQFFSTLETFQGEPVWKLQASVIEGYTFLPSFESARMDILPAQREAKNRYLSYTPCTWTMINNHKVLFVQASVLWDMMVLTMCNFQMDEYMETAAAKLDADKLGQEKNTIRMLCTGADVEKVAEEKAPS